MDGGYTSPASGPGPAHLLANNLVEGSKTRGFVLSGGPAGARGLPQNANIVCPPAVLRPTGRHSGLCSRRHPAVRPAPHPSIAAGSFSIKKNSFTCIDPGATAIELFPNAGTTGAAGSGYVGSVDIQDNYFGWVVGAKCLYVRCDTHTHIHSVACGCIPPN